MTLSVFDVRFWSKICGQKKQRKKYEKSLSTNHYILSPENEKILFNHFLEIHFFIDYDKEKKYSIFRD